MELLRLEDSVRSQARERGRLAQEKEQLQWKMKRGSHSELRRSD